MPDHSPQTILFDHDLLFRLRTNGSQSLIVDFKKDSNPLEQIHQLSEYLLSHPPESLINVIPASCSVTLVFSKNVTANGHWQDFLTLALDTCRLIPIQTQTHTIGVCYQTQFPNKLATDINSVCEILQCTRPQLIEAHCSATYRVDMLGFLPGFAYLSGLPDALQLPRKSKPALKVPAGGVAIAEQYSAIYPVDSPGGWHLIGHTNFKVIDWHQSIFSPFKPLDRVQFVPISITEWAAQQTKDNR